MRTPHLGPEWVHARPTPTEVVRAFSPPDPAPVLAGVKVVRPVGRSTLTPAAAGGTSQQREASQPSSPTASGLNLPCTLDKARPHGCGDSGVMVHAFECSARPGPEPHTPHGPSSCGNAHSHNAATTPRSLNDLSHVRIVRRD